MSKVAKVKCNGCEDLIEEGSIFYHYDDKDYCFDCRMAMIEKIDDDGDFDKLVKGKLPIEILTCEEEEVD